MGDNRDVWARLNRLEEITAGIQSTIVHLEKAVQNNTKAIGDLQRAVSSLSAQVATVVSSWERTTQLLEDITNRLLNSQMEQSKASTAMVNRILDISWRLALAFAGGLLGVKAVGLI